MRTALVSAALFVLAGCQKGTPAPTQVTSAAPVVSSAPPSAATPAAVTATPALASSRALASAVVTATSAPSAQVGEAANLVARAAVLNGKCRGGSGASSDTQRACDDRDAAVKRLKELGLCWGHAGQVGADKKWERCSGALSAITADDANGIADEMRANDKCRGGSGASPDTKRACDERDVLVKRLKAAGLCWGHAGQTGADMKWEVCTPTAAK